MEVKVKKTGINYAEVEIEGEEHTLGSLLVDLLLKEDHVKIASYSLPHPLVEKIVIKILTDGEIEPKVALEKAIEKGIELSKKFQRDVEEI
ncbi:DNA-directed RNA polymerase subunit L [Sulfodiicoccus acidiphilus]|uniref:DNA-directed RNA polymerase subunit Rpo11 n=1 Tax=Sulfodiicoccus acidiphilus TaxID=1670455 RepID=A0A348B701_9CREN|nr:DNA-directed RNA polymerase subunit L [Sulfodiicoccus acidiphilus]BBD73953.1 DNA-directed RNA polymerase subunit L [Sulfodiicoccus acidiphilus]GGU03211.1 DNA-directed RNA polymerase subunit L [Sulfodiicoccus acidiphilus]